MSGSVDAQVMINPNNFFDEIIAVESNQVPFAIEKYFPNGKDIYFKLLETIKNIPTTSTNNDGSKVRNALNKILQHTTNKIFLERIKRVCIRIGLHPINDQPEMDDSLYRYRTLNLIPVCAREGKFGGKVITVKLDPDFDLIDTHLRIAREIGRGFYAAEREYHAQKKVAVAPRYEPGGPPPLTPLTHPMTPIIRTEIEELKKLQKMCPGYSENPESSNDPQGDVNWILFLPENLKTFMEFSKIHDQYSFPTFDELNNAITKFNLCAEKQGFGKNYIPFKLVEVDGMISPADLIHYTAESLLPIGKPKTGSSWMYHDLLYHTIGMLLTPRDVLLKSIKFSKEFIKRKLWDGKVTERVARHIDHNTTYAIRLIAKQYRKKHPEAQIHYFNGEDDYKIVYFAFFAIAGSQYISYRQGKLHIPLLESKGYYKEYSKFIESLDHLRMTKLLNYEVIEHMATLDRVAQQILTS